MNDHAREVLTKHALLGTKQAFGTLKDVHGGMCAVGVLSYELLGEARLCESAEELKRYRTAYGLDFWKESEIIAANDKLKWDFLTIARKCCTGPHPGSPLGEESQES
jgi:hypothetical protein